MGQLVLGLAGAAVGFFVGGPAGAAVGWSLGSLAGSLLFPAQQQGPRLDDTKVQGAEYGTCRPKLYGTMRVGGIGMGQGSTSDGPNTFTEHKEKSGGKGGPETTSFRYTLSFFNEICEGVIRGVDRRWANGRLINRAGETPDPQTWPFTLYRGDAAQMPDPTMEIIYGTGEVSPMRGVAYEAIEEVDVTKNFGNSRPNVEYEAYTNSGDPLYRISTFVPDFPLSNYGGSLTGYAVCGASVVNGKLSVGYYERTLFGGGDWTYTHYTIAFDGTIEDTVGPISVEHIPDNGFGNVSLNLQPAANCDIAFGTLAVQGQDNPSASGWYVAGLLANYPVNNVAGSPRSHDSVTPSTLPFLSNGYLYVIGSTSSSALGSHVARYQIMGGGSPNSTADAYAVFASAAGGYQVTADENGDIWVMGPSGASVELKHYDAELNLLATIANADMPPEFVATTHQVQQFTVHGGNLIWDEADVGDYNIKAYTLPPAPTLVAITSRPAMASPYIGGPVTWLGGCYALAEDGLFNICAPPAAVVLGDIVKDLLVRAGLDETQIDTTDLTQEVRGYLLASQMTVFNAIDTLRKGYFFDVTEYDGKIVARNRGHDAIATIPDGDLGAHEPGSEPPEPLEFSRMAESELPRSVWVNYYDYDNDYQRGSQPWSRTVTSSQAKVTVELPLSLTASEALHIAQWHMHFAWLERDKFSFSTTRQWSKLTPTDVVVVRGINIRITNKVESPNGLIKFEGVRAFAGPFAPHETEPGLITGTPGSGQPPQTPPKLPVSTQLVLLDIPITSQQDSIFGFYAAMGPSGNGPWPGAALYKSVDGGVTWAQIASTASPAVIGRATSALDNYSGGAALDTASGPVTIVLTDDDATLSSCTSTALTNGANLCAIESGAGWELLQFQNATLTATKTYEIDQPYYRGLKGTSVFNATHAADDTFVQLPVLHVDAPESELNVALKYKAVTFGTALADAAEVDFTNTGQGYNGVTPVVPPTTITAGTYMIQPTDRGKILEFNNAAGVAVTLPQAGALFPSGWFVWVKNAGVGNVVITPTTSTIDGASSLTLTTGQGALITSDGVNYITGGKTGTGSGSGVNTESNGTPVNTPASAVNFLSPLTAVPNGTETDVDLPNFVGDSGSGGAAGGVPAPTSGDAALGKFLKASGAWVTPEPSDGDKGDIVVSSNGSVWVIDAGAVTNTHLQSMVQSRIKGRAAGAGTGAPTDLTPAQSTEILDAMVGDSGSGGTKGLAPAPASGDTAAGKFLKASGGWAVPPGFVGVAGTSFVYSDGVDGSVVFDGTNTFTFASKSGSVYTLTADVFGTIVQIDASVTVRPNGFRIFANAELIHNGLIENDGNDAVTFTRGNLKTNSSSYLQNGSGAIGGVAGISAVGGVGGSLAAATFGFGGGGGAGGAGSSNGGGNAGTVAAPASTESGVKILSNPFLVFTGGRWLPGSGTLTHFSGGAGGGGGGGNGGNAGAGGGGAWVVVIYAATISGNGTVRCRGGVGGNATTGNSGGGGGGGGGFIYVVTGTSNWQSLLTTNVLGGVKGTKVGTGVDGSDGSPGTVKSVILT